MKLLDKKEIQSSSKKAFSARSCVSRECQSHERITPQLSSQGIIDFTGTEIRKICGCIFLQAYIF